MARMGDKDERDKRLKQALRDNLRRRKAAARKPDTVPSVPPAKSTEPD
ncbi:MAG: hypothetical protein AAFO63_04930 [Pseudomonadota bacterium]